MWSVKWRDFFPASRLPQSLEIETLEESKPLRKQGFAVVRVILGNSFKFQEGLPGQSKGTPMYPGYINAFYMYIQIVDIISIWSVNHLYVVFSRWLPYNTRLWHYLLFDQ
jgi:hypothetical protein